jgi:hypothetical protein
MVEIINNKRHFEADPDIPWGGYNTVHHHKPHPRGGGGEDGLIDIL